MFTPERMKLMFIFASEEKVPELTLALAKKSIFHLINTDKLSLLKDFHPDLSAKKILSGVTHVEQELKDICEELGCRIPKKPDPTITNNPEELLAGTENEIMPFKSELNRVKNEIAAYNREAMKLAEQVALLSFWEDKKLDMKEISNFDFLTLFYGFIDTEETPELKKSLDHITHEIIIGPLIDRYRRPVCVVTTKENEEEAERILHTLPFEHRTLINKYPGTIYDVLEEIETDVWENRENEAESRTRMDALKAMLITNLPKWHNALSAVKTTAFALTHYSKYGGEYALSGWVPASRTKEFAEAVSELGDDIFLHELKDNELKEVSKAPTLLNNFSLFKPFEHIVKMYSLPDYDSIDPTPFVAVAFLTMFGIMFGDIGHGSILALAGLTVYMLFRSFAREIADIGKIIMLCGLSGVVFGFLFGSIFGDEEIIHHLWINPMKDINTLLASCLLLGMIIMSLGMILNIFSHALRRDYRGAIFNEWGLISLLLYWLLAGLGIAMISEIIIKPDWRIIGPLLGFPVLLLILKPNIYAVLDKIKGTKKEGSHSGHSEHEETNILESSIEAAVMLLEYITGTLSFLRVAAFALNHAALCTAVYLTAEIIRESFTSSPALSMFIIVLGNLMIIALESVIVFIQCLRLNFYEFFSKFFRGEGKEYNPLKISE